jgi:hypothetical protein
VRRPGGRRWRGRRRDRRAPPPAAALVAAGRSRNGRMTRSLIVGSFFYSARDKIVTRL